MSLQMTAHIVFEKRGNRPQITVTQPHSVQIESSWKLLTDTAEVILPRNVSYFDRNQIREVFRRGDACTISLGYDGNNLLEFSGYITEVSADIPIKIRLEDEMWKLKQIPVSYSSPNASLKECLQSICKGYEIEALEGVQLGVVRFTKTTVAEVLKKLQEEWKLYSYMKGKTLVCGKVYSDDSLRPHYFHLERNCVSNDLQYKRKEDVLVKVNGQFIYKGDKIEFSHGDENPQTEINWTYSVRSLSDLKVEVIRTYENYKKGGFDGSFTAFGVPSVSHGEKVKLDSSLYEDRSGEYYIQSVSKEFGTGGYRQKITLEKAA